MELKSPWTTWLVACLLGISGRARANPKAAWVESGFPVLGLTVDARDFGGDSPRDNLAIRGEVLFLGHGCYACFDTDLLRFATIWEGGFMQLRSLAAVSYEQAGKKVPGGQSFLSRPAGSPLTATGLYPGISGSEFIPIDPRRRGPDSRDLGRGPVPISLGRWRGVYRAGEHAVLHYEVFKTAVYEYLEALDLEGPPVVSRVLKVGAHARPLQFVVTEVAPGQSVSRSRARVGEAMVVETGEGGSALTLVLARGRGATLVYDDTRVIRIRLAPSAVERSVQLLIARGKIGLDQVAARSAPMPDVEAGGTTRWPDVVSTRGILSRKTSAYVMDRIELPDPNPGHRQVRVSGLAFFDDGRAALVTFDGDVWIASGLSSNLNRVSWKRIAAGLHEPQSLCVRQGALFVFTRNGILRLHDLNGDQEIDYYECFANGFTQSAETREFPMDMLLASDGGFYIAKGGQQEEFQGIHNGSVLKVSPDGNTVEVIATGLRQPYLGYNPATELLTATDQQGNWVPSTALHWIRRGCFYGFRPRVEVVPAGNPTTEPIVWIPHRVMASAAGQVWLPRRGYGPLGGRLLVMDYFQPRICAAYFEDDLYPIQGAVVPLPLSFEGPALKARLNPADGRVYFAGFKIWGSIAKRWSGFWRLRYTGASGGISFPSAIGSTRTGIYLRFSQALASGARANGSSLSVQRWNYRRTKGYGSGQYRLDGQPGTEFVPVDDAFLSDDGLGVFLAISDMRPAMQYEVVYRLAMAAGAPIHGTAYLTLHRLRDASSNDLGFSRRAPLAIAGGRSARQQEGASPEVSVQQGRWVYQSMGCIACHSIDGTTQGRIGPTLLGVLGRKRAFSKGEPLIADASYVRESILFPAKRVVRSYASSDIGMPSYEGVLTAGQIESVIRFLRFIAAGAK